MAAKKKNKASANPGVSKTQFVLGLPRDLSAKDVVTKAKSAGLKLSEAYVYKIRSASKGSAPKAKASKGAPKAAAAAAGPRKAGMSKVDFVRSLPPGTSYADAATQAKPLGIELSKAYFYVLKSENKKATGGGATAPKVKAAKAPKGAKAAAAPRAAKASSSTNGLRLTSNDRSEQALIDAVRALGAERSRTLIATIEKFEHV